MNGRRGKARRGTLYLLTRRARSRRAKGIDPRVSACPLQTLIHVSPNVPRGTISTAAGVLKSVALGTVHQGAGHRKCSTRWRTKFALTRECLPTTGMPWSLTAVLLSAPCETISTASDASENVWSWATNERKGYSKIAPRGALQLLALRARSRRSEGVDPGRLGLPPQTPIRPPQMFHVEQSRRHLVH